MRVLFSIVSPQPGAPSQWKVRASFEGGPWERQMLQQADPDGGLLPFPDPATLAPGEPPPGGLAADTPASVWEVYQEIVGREPPHIAAYGQYLFDNLLGPVRWKEILDYAENSGQRMIELALSWAPQDVYAARLHWEMMHDGAQFLGAGRIQKSRMTDIAITRVVAGTTAEAATLGDLPRVLFVIGTSVFDRTIRPGAEVMALLRNPDVELRIFPSVLENASPATVQKRVADFLPEVVHFICHGKIDLATNTGVIEMKPDPNNPQTLFGASQVWQWLTAGGTPPKIVILSACQTGTSAVPVDVDPLQTQSIGPLAAELVEAGVPVVVAMSGRVSDLACRLFTRSFARALVMGSTIVAATAKGRRAAIAEGDAAKQSVDWGFPTVYLSAKVKPDYAPSTGAAGNSAFQNRVLAYELRRDQPVFCGRNEFFEAFSDLFSNPERGGVLVAYAPEDTRELNQSYGRTRLLEELVVQALREGHLPCAVLASRKTWTSPTSPRDLALAINRAMDTCRQALGLPAGGEGPIISLSYVSRGTMQPRELDAELRQAVNMSSQGAELVGPAAYSLAIQRQFVDLVTEARLKKPGIVTAKSRAVLLLDDLHKYFSDFDSIVADRKMGVWGFGTPEEPVPVVVAFPLRTLANDLLKPITESDRAGWRPLQLDKFARDPDRPEDMRAYATVLLYPFDIEEKIAKGFSGGSWVMDYNIARADVAECEAKYRRWLHGWPGEFKDPKFYMAAEMALDRRFLKKATDNEQLKKLIAEEGG